VSGYYCGLCGALVPNKKDHDPKCSVLAIVRERDAAKAERDQARNVAREEFTRIQRDLAEGERYNALGRIENEKLRAKVAALELQVSELEARWKQQMQKEAHANEIMLNYEQLLSAAGQWLHATAPLHPRAPEIRELADKIFEEIKGAPLAVIERPKQELCNSEKDGSFCKRPIGHDGVCEDDTHVWDWKPTPYVRGELPPMTKKANPECRCGKDANPNLPRRDIVCPKHDLADRVKRFSEPGGGA
jgi:hypothetical protein